MTKIVYKINGYVNDVFISWLQAQTGFLAIVQQGPYEVYTRFDHTMAQQETFRQALETRLALNPDDVVKKDIISTEFMTLKNTTTPPTPPAGQIALYPDQSTGKVTVKKSDGSTIDLEATGGTATAREDLVAQWDVSATKTNIGITFVDVFTQANSDGKSVQIDTNGKTLVKLQVLWNKVGTDVGTQTVQVLEVGTANVLITMTVIAGKNTTALTAIPAFATNTVKFYKLQCKSTTAADDPVFEGARIYLK